jgi:hypothetical protein
VGDGNAWHIGEGRRRRRALAVEDL